jgi:hypothetical protein
MPEDGKQQPVTRSDGFVIGFHGSAAADRYADIL